MKAAQETTIIVNRLLRYLSYRDLTKKVAIEQTRLFRIARYRYPAYEHEYKKLKRLLDKIEGGSKNENW